MMPTLPFRFLLVAVLAALCGMSAGIAMAMTQNFALYPQKWNLAKPDTNIDHRRVPNLQTCFTRKRKSVTITQKAEDYKPGDIVSWDLDGKGMTHIGVVSNVFDESAKRYSIIHNLGGGAKLEADIVQDRRVKHGHEDAGGGQRVQAGDAAAETAGDQRQAAHDGCPHHGGARAGQQCVRDDDERDGEHRAGLTPQTPGEG